MDQVLANQAKLKEQVALKRAKALDDAQLNYWQNIGE
jgi:hypothetical protein